ncbi:hypothetical protein [Nocardia sp. NPDC051570]|uniref:hypothetical protein n=1 Tax=Nocardia sp. NPDC051570 TaxID=3364324 RepID=UPI0037AF5B70
MTTAMRTPAPCQYPLSADRLCGKPVRQRSGPGAPSLFCEHPEHTARCAFDRRKKFRQQAEKAAARQPVSSTRPVTDGTATLAELVGRLSELRDEFAAVLVDAGDLVATITDPHALAEEIAHVRRECAEQLAVAGEARAMAERRAADAERERDAARADAEIAAAAADEAIAEHDATLARATRIVDEAKAQIAEVEQDRDRIYAEDEAVLREAAQRVEAARSAAAVADDQRRAAAQVAEEATAEARKWREQLDIERAQWAEEQSVRVSELTAELVGRAPQRESNRTRPWLGTPGDGAVSWPRVRVHGVSARFAKLCDSGSLVWLEPGGTSERLIPI